MPPETDLGPFFHPRAIAVVGASDDPARPGFALLKKVAARAERDGASVFAVNPRLREIDGIPCYPTLADVPAEVDVAVILIANAEQGVRDAVAKRVKFAVVFAAGFGEIGAEGAKREEELARIARDGGVRLFGPNTNVNAFETFPDVPGRKIGLITQSGHQGRPIAQGVELNIGVKYWAPTGNEADLELADFVEFFADDPDIAVVAAYVEGFRSAGRLRAAAEKALRTGTPIVLVKVGRTEEGRRTALAHTGHLTGADDVHDAFFRQYGMIRVDDLDELLDTAAMFCRTSEPVPGRDGVCVYAISGGTGAHLADLCAHAGLRVPPLTDATQKRLREVVPDYLSVSNPVDNGGRVVQQPGANRRLMEIALADENVGVLLCPITGVLPGLSKIVATDIVEVARGAAKPVVAVWSSPVTDDEGYRTLVDAQVPLFRSFRAAAAGVRRWLDYWDRRRRFEPREVTAPRIPAGLETMLAGSGPLGEMDAATVASSYSVPFPWSDVATDAESAERLALRRGPLVAMKACGPGILHKSEHGLVRLGVSIEDARRVFGELEEAARAHAGEGGYEGVLVQPMIDGGEEVIAGFSQDPQFGPVVLFGLGGIFAEVLRDVALRVAPLTRRDAEEMIREVRAFPLLDGARGRPRADLDALAGLLMNVSRMAMDLRDRVVELDLNPVRVFPAGGGLMALDCLLVRR